MVMTDEIKNETVEEEVEASGKEVEDEVKHEVLDILTGFPIAIKDLVINTPI